MESKITHQYRSAFCGMIFAWALLLSNACFSADYTVRVAILNDVSEFSMSIRGQYHIIDPLSNVELSIGRQFRTAVVKPAFNGIMVGDIKYTGRHVRVMTNKDVTIYTKDKSRKYRQQMDIIRNDQNRLLVVNTVDMESYVKGVLYHEVPHYWPLEAIEAQAVATRTYALYQLLEKKKQAFDVTSDIYSQVYGGRSAERYRSNIAAGRTKGKVLTYKNKVLPAYFHSTCAGHTENVSEVWKQDLKPLRGVVCGFCTLSPHYRWKKNFRSQDIQAQLNGQEFKVGLIKSLEVIKRTESGRVKTIKITMRDGTTETISGIRFREIIGPNNLKSNLYDIEMKGYYFDVIGRGWGHGVGMCQWGVFQMARERYEYPEILAHYYPGARIQRISDL